VIFKLKKDEISQVIETPMGYHIFRIEERKEQYTKKFEEVREQIYGMLFQQKSIERFQEWMKDLKRNAYISLH
jgi:parvulin-like peptidyl-prolyl isomerase